MGIRVGIDLGTTYTKVAFVDEIGKACAIPNIEGTHITPSVVFFDSDDTVVVGEIAKETAFIEPDRTVSGVKKYIGKTGFDFSYGNRNWAPEEISALIIKKVINDAENILNENITEVVVTVPAYFGIVESTAMKNACELAGLNVINVLTETTAIALSYGLECDIQEKTILIYDLGGATFETAVARVNGGKTDIICIDGEGELGGNNWDEAIMQNLISEFCSETGFDGELDEYAYREFRLKAEKAKKQLSSRVNVPVMLDVDGTRTRIVLSRTTFEEITNNLLNKTIEKTDSVIAFAASKGHKIDEILLVGGSTRMPQIREILCNRYGIEPKMYDPELVIAKGAAIYAMKDNSIDVHPVCTKSYGIKILKDGKELCHNFIVKNTQFSGQYLSVSSGALGVSDSEIGVINLAIYESDSIEDCFPVDDNLIMGTLKFRVPHKAFKVKFSLSLDGVLEVSCVDEETGAELTSVRFGVNM